LLHKKLRVRAGRFLYPFPGYANAFPRLDRGYRSHKGVRLQIALVPQLEAIWPGDCATGQVVVMVYGVVDANPDSRAYGSDGNADPDLVGMGNAADLAA
jgi:hypothetical protein